MRSAGAARRCASRRASATPLEPGEFFQSDLIGCEVVERATGECLGRVTGWQEAGGSGPAGGGRRPADSVRAVDLRGDRSGGAAHRGGIARGPGGLEPAVIFHVLTIFPEFFEGPFAHGVVARARDAGLLEIRIHNLRDWTFDRHKTVDDRPFGGGEGMVLKPEPIFLAVESIWPERGAGPRRWCCFRRRAACSTRRRPTGLSAARGTAADLRPLRGRGRARGRAPGRRRDLDRQLRAERRRTGGGGGGRCGGAAAAGRAGQRELRRCSNRFRRRAWRGPAGLPALDASGGVSAAGRCPRCC